MPLSPAGDRLNDAVSILKSKPVNGNKMYDIIYMTFLGPDKLMHEDLLYRLDISARHYYRLRTQAINIIALRLWSAPAGEVDSWLEVLSILGKLVRLKVSIITLLLQERDK